jgi:hypothetical protein
MKNLATSSLVAAFVLSGCASTGNYPSLERRAAERVTGSAEPVASAPAEPVSQAHPTPGLAQRLATLVARARAAQGRFSEQRSRTESLVGAGAGASVASESWSIATVALAGLEGARSEALIALAELDQLYLADRVANFDSPGADSPAIIEAWNQVSAIIAAQDAVLARLRARLRS